MTSAAAGDAPEQVGFSFANDVRPAPFFKWVGGKRQLMPELLARVPRHFNTYFEPFLGAGALFFELCPKRAVLADLNSRLIRTYRGVQNHPYEVMRRLDEMKPEREVFLDQRVRNIDAENDEEVASWFLYLNRTGFNGLYRVNRKGQFNVPFGKYTKYRFYDRERLLACSNLLQNAQLVISDFEECVSEAQEGDFVYFDPPYVAASQYSDFARYTSEGFGPSDQIRLRDLAASLKNRGVHVLLSNSDTPEVRELYAEFTVDEVMASRAVNSKGNRRGKVTEVLIS